MNAVSVKAWELKTGDRILGTSLVVTGPYQYSEGDIGSAKFRMRFTYPLHHQDRDTETAITYTADSSVIHVLRGDSGKA